MKSGWMRRIRAAAAVLALAGGVWAQGAGGAEIKNVTALFLWPWTNAVGIEWEVDGEVAMKSSVAVVASDRYRSDGYIALADELSGDTSLSKGTHAEKHCVLWNLATQRIGNSPKVEFTVVYFPESYCVVDLSGGTNAPSYPVTYLDAPPSGGFNTDAYKTTKLVLRRVDAGTFTMGYSSAPYQVTLTKPFYVGLFEVTQKQWTLVMGDNPMSSYTGDMLPVGNVNYNMIRGSSTGTNWPASNAVDASSFLGKLRAKTGLEFDLPTEAQWEYACRAGTTNTFNNGGDNSSCMRKLGKCWPRFSPVGSVGPTNAGCYTANAGGLYDMHGNMSELCLDWFGELSAGTDPKGPSSGSERVMRGGGWNTDEFKCTSYSRDSIAPTNTNNSIGFRLVRPLSE